MKRLSSFLCRSALPLFLLGGAEFLAAASFSGATEGRFVRPLGPVEMVVDGTGSAQVDWGRIRPGSEVPSYFRFESDTFSAEEGVPFVLGAFEYSNGENAIGSAPESLDLEIDITFSDGTGDTIKTFVFPIVVGSTTNGENSESSADSVSIGKRFAENELLVGEERFVLGLEFGRTSAEGFSIADQFSVFESQVATAELVATIARVDVLSGRSAGVFDNPLGLETKITGGEGTDTFTWGEPPPGAGPNRFHFEGASFEVVTGVPSTIGRFEYFNGSVRTGTAADTLDLMLLLEFPGAALRSFRFPLRIISTPNSADREASADIVQLEVPASERQVEVDGRTFSLELSFSNATEGGFTERDRFFVFEDAVAKADLQATLSELLPEPEPDLALNIRTAVEVEFQTFPGGRYRIQSSIDLIEWGNEGEVIVGDGRKFQQFFSVPVGSIRVFRVIDAIEDEE